MIAVTKKGIDLIVPLHNLQDLLFLQLAVIGAIQNETESGKQVDGFAVVKPLADLLQATLFSEDQMNEIQAHFQSKAKAQRVAA